MTGQDFAVKYFGTTKTAEPFQALTVNWAGDPATAPTGVQTVTPINPTYCATDQCAKDLLSVLGIGGTITEDFPEPGWPSSNMYSQSGKVPYYTFSGFNAFNAFVSFTMRAGEAVAVFTHGLSPEAALASLKFQIGMALQNATPAE